MGHWPLPDCTGGAGRSAPAIALERAQVFLHFIVVADKADNQRIRRYAKQHAKPQTDTAFKQVGSQFSNSQAAMLVRLAEGVS